MSYREAAALLWGEAGDYITAEYERLNAAHFGNQLPPVPMVIGLAAYGRCLGMTRGQGAWTGRTPRITVASTLFERGRRHVADVILHEMVHAKLMLNGLDPAHNAEPWCAEIVRLSPAVLGHSVQAAPVKPRRVPNPDREHNPDAPNTLVRRLPLVGHLKQADLARWPYALRPDDWDPGAPIHVDTY